MKNLEEYTDLLAEKFPADEILDALAASLRVQSSDANEPLASKLYAAASICFGSATSVRENWHLYDREKP